MLLLNRHKLFILQIDYKLEKSIQYYLRIILLSHLKMILIYLKKNIFILIMMLKGKTYHA